MQLNDGERGRLDCSRRRPADGPSALALTRMIHTGFLRIGGTGYQPVLVGNLPTRRGRAPCRDEQMRRKTIDVALPPGW